MSQYQTWQDENPDGDLDTYLNGVKADTLEVSEQVLAELPETIRPDRESLLQWVQRAGDYVREWSGE